MSWAHAARAVLLAIVHVPIVGGGDTALESAVTIAEQPGAVVTLSYRSAAFMRAKKKNRDKLEAARAAGRVSVLLESTLRRIEQDHVEIEQRGKRSRIRNDAVIVNAGGVLPTPLLKEIGIDVETKYGTR